jgi:hypothetical protein
MITKWRGKATQTRAEDPKMKDPFQTGQSASAKQIRRRCERLVDTLDIPKPFRVDELISRVAAHRGRPIDLRAVSMPTESPYGMWLPDADRDLIIFERNTSGLHQEHLKLHEVGHVLLNHPPTTAVLSPLIVQALWPDLDPAVVTQVLQRARCFVWPGRRPLPTLHPKRIRNASTWLTSRIRAPRRGPLPDDDPERERDAELERELEAELERELEAELIASLILQKASRWQPQSDWIAPADAADIRQRLSSAFEHPDQE